MDKDARKVLEAAAEQGFDVRPTKRKHVMVYDREGKFVTTFSGTSGDVKAIRNALAAMRRHGFIWPKPKK